MDYFLPFLKRECKTITRSTQERTSYLYIHKIITLGEGYKIKKQSAFVHSNSNALHPKLKTLQQSLPT